MKNLVTQVSKQNPHRTTLISNAQYDPNYYTEYYNQEANVQQNQEANLQQLPQYVARGKMTVPEHPPGWSDRF